MVEKMRIMSKKKNGIKTDREIRMLHREILDRLLKLKDSYSTCLEEIADEIYNTEALRNDLASVENEARELIDYIKQRNGDVYSLFKKAGFKIRQGRNIATPQVLLESMISRYHESLTTLYRVREDYERKHKLEEFKDYIENLYAIGANKGLKNCTVPICTTSSDYLASKRKPKQHDKNKVYMNVLKGIHKRLKYSPIFPEKLDRQIEEQIYQEAKKEGKFAETTDKFHIPFGKGMPSEYRVVD